MAERHEIIFTEIKKKLAEIKRQNPDTPSFYPYQILKHYCKKNVQDKYGDILTNCSLPDDFNLSSLSDDFFHYRYYQEMPLPFNDKLIEDLIAMPKLPLHISYPKTKGKYSTQGAYLIGLDENKKPMLFALSIVRDTSSVDSDYTIKLDFCPQGKTWIQLCRLDMDFNAKHVNLLKGDQLHNKITEAEFIKGPHLHTNSQAHQIYFKDYLDEPPAIAVPNLDRNFDLFEGDYKCKNAVDYFIKHTNSLIDIANYDLRQDCPLFSLVQSNIGNMSPSHIVDNWDIAMELYKEDHEM